MSEFDKIIANCAPYFRTWVTVALDVHEWYLARPNGAMHLVEPVYCPRHSSQEGQVATYRLVKEADRKYVQEALQLGVVAVYTEEKCRGLIRRWINCDTAYPRGRGRGGETE